VYEADGRQKKKNQTLTKFYVFYCGALDVDFWCIFKYFMADIDREFAAKKNEK